MSAGGVDNDTTEVDPQARLVAMEHLVMLLLHKAGGKATITAADVNEVRSRRPSMVRWPQTDPTQFELELIDEDGRAWKSLDAQY
ncbi:MAG TPA: hypothetical protein VGP33_08780 [Chloroflexota bacterium]|nr:hypothetical protein [Chloroflexota bacterium]